jgi:hypothetical protein
VNGSLERYVRPPFKGGPTRISIVVAAPMAGLSAAGLLWPGMVYPTEELLQSFLANDGRERSCS